MDRSERQRRVDEVPFWWHSIDVGDGVVTPGKKTAAHVQGELASLRLPSLKGKSVLDIGAWDGFYSFACERAGAERVVAMDYHVWNLDTARYLPYLEECKARGVAPDRPQESGMWNPEAMPGKRGFNTAHALLDSRVETVYADFITVDSTGVGSFDVTLFLGVLYHLENPLEGLRRVAGVTREMAIIETECISIPGYNQHPLCVFHEANTLNSDPESYYSHNEAAVHALCRDAGFRRVETVKRQELAPHLASLKRGNPVEAVLKKLGSAMRFLRAPRPVHYRGVFHAYK